jgi:hypothetical protein
MLLQDSLSRAAAKAAARVTFYHGLGIVLVALGALFAVANARVLARQLRRTSPGEQAPSFVPFAGGILGVVGLGLLEVPWNWRWLPLLLDFGAGPLLIAGAWASVFQRESAPPPPSDTP